MSRKQPCTAGELLSVSGVGKVKQQRYGAVFLEVIRRFRGETLSDETVGEGEENDGSLWDTEEAAYGEEPPFPSEPPPAQWVKDEDGAYWEISDTDWSDEDDGKLLILLGDDRPIEEMAAYFRRTPNEVFERLKELGMIRKPKI